MRHPILCYYATHQPATDGAERQSTMTRYRWVIITLFLLAAFGLRLYRLDVVDLRGDEAYSVLLWTATPFTPEWTLLLQREPAPVGAFTMYWLWNGALGTSVFATRLLSVLTNTASIAVMLALARRLTRSWRLAALIAVVWACNPFLVWHAQDARTYGPSSALSLLSFYWLVRALEQKAKPLRVWRPYIITQLMAVYIYYFEVFWLIAGAVYVICYHREQIGRALKAWAIIAIGMIPVIAQAYVLLILNRYEGTAGEQSILIFLTDFWPTLLFGDNQVPWPIGALGILVYLAIVGAHIRRQRYMGLVFIWALVPSALLFVASFFSNYREPRYILMVAPALTIGLIWGLYLGLERWRPQLRWRGVIALVALMLALSALEIRAYFFYDPPKAIDWSGMTAYLRARTTSDDVIVIGAIDPALEYYYRGPADIFFIPYQRENELDLYQALLNYRAIYLITGPTTGAAHQYLDQHAQHIPGDAYRGIVQFRPWAVTEDEIQTPLALTFGDIARLRGYTLLSGEGAPILLLYWQALRRTEEEYSILLHLQPADGAPLVYDHGLANARLSFTQWESGVTYRDPIPLNGALAASDYTLYVGLYPTAAPQQPLSADAQADANGRYRIGQIRWTEKTYR